MLSGWAGLSRWMKGLIIASVALNLAIAGIVTAVWVRHGGKHHHGGGIERTLIHFARTLPAERKRMLRQMWRQERRDLAPLFDKVRDARKTAAAALQADVYDRGALKDALQSIRESRGQVRTRLTERFLDYIDQLTVQERRNFGAFILEHDERRWRRHRRWRKRD